jgi:hypothetical protein
MVYSQIIKYPPGSGPVGPAAATETDFPLSPHKLRTILGLIRPQSAMLSPSSYPGATPPALFLGWIFSR